MRERFHSCLPRSQLLTVLEPRRWVLFGILFFFLLSPRLSGSSLSVSLRPFLSLKPSVALCLFSHRHECSTKFAAGSKCRRQ